MALGSLDGKTFLDIGCGSGIHSLAAVKLGASHVFSFDYDNESVECCREMNRRFAPEANWHIEQGSALDEAYIRSLGPFDVVYSWGVLHHTGDMWKALGLARIPAREKLMVSIYNDQGFISVIWKRLKRLYVRHPLTRPAVVMLALAHMWAPKLLFLPHRVVRDWRSYSKKRGMSAWHDVVDWAGGYPYEYAKPEEVFDFFHQRGLQLVKLKTCRGRLCCNEFVFTMQPAVMTPETEQAGLRQAAR
ncbi:MAG TPA: class I SAM-dependent methyltransferase [Alphaproteobacteria bacterium]|nr:class I SAM-dependent methyltransferase [Alphaproteobacteria bacterium]